MQQSQKQSTTSNSERITHFWTFFYKRLNHKSKCGSQFWLQHYTVNSKCNRAKSMTSTSHQFTFHLTTTDRSITFSTKEPVSNLYVTEKAAMRSDITRGWSYSAIWTSRDRQCKTDPDVTVLYWSTTRPHGKQNLYTFVQNTGQTEKLTRGDSNLNYPFF